MATIKNSFGHPNHRFVGRILAKLFLYAQIDDSPYAILVTASHERITKKHD